MSVKQFIDIAMHLGPIWYVIIISLCTFVVGLIIGSASERTIEKISVYEIEVE